MTFVKNKTIPFDDLENQLFTECSIDLEHLEPLCKGFWNPQADFNKI